MKFFYEYSTIPEYMATATVTMLQLITRKGTKMRIFTVNKGKEH